MSARERVEQELDIRDLCRPLGEASPSPMAAVEGAGHIIRYVNPAFCRLAGRPEEELIGIALSCAVPADDELMLLFDRVQRTGQSETYTGNGRPTPTLFYSCALWPVLAGDGGAKGIIIQVTETKPAHDRGVATNQALLVAGLQQHELQEATNTLNAQLQAEIVQRERSEGRLRALLESASEGIVVIDEGGTILLVNAMSERLFGCSRGELLGRPIENLLVEDARAIHSGHRRNYFSHPRTRPMGAGMSLAGRRKDGSTFPVEISLSFVREGESSVVLALIDDITERQLVQDRLREAAKFESLGVLAGGIAHDFNNSLTSVLGFASMAMDQLPAGSSIREMIGEIIRSGERAAQLTSQILAYSGQGRFIVKPVNLSEFTRRVVTLVRSSIPRTPEVDLQLVDEVPLIEADIAQLQQLVVNLLINAGEAIGEASGIVTVRTGVREFSEGHIGAVPKDTNIAPGRYVFLEMTDTGAGMDESTRQRIFDPFFTTKFTGRGLGLSAVLGIVRGHRGAIEVESTLGRGSTFTVLFPETTSCCFTKPATRDLGPLINEPAEAGGSGTVLVVDDEAAIRKMAQLILKQAGYEVVVAENGAAAIDMFRKFAGQIAAVLLDMTMPVMNGSETLRLLRDLDPHVPVALSSGFDQSEALARFPVQTVDAFVQKPYTAAQLVEKINRVVAASRKSNTTRGRSGENG